MLNSLEQAEKVKVSGILKTFVYENRTFTMSVKHFLTEYAKPTKSILFSRKQSQFAHTTMKTLKSILKPHSNSPAPKCKVTLKETSRTCNLLQKHKGKVSFLLNIQENPPRTKSIVRTLRKTTYSELHRGKGQNSSRRFTECKPFVCLTERRMSTRRSSSFFNKYQSIEAIAVQKQHFSYARIE